LHHSTTPSLHYSITPLLHHSTTPSLHYSITPLLHHSTTPSLHHRILFMKLRVAGINFDHMHMGDLLRMVAEHPQSELVGICDEQPARMQIAIRNFDIPRERVFTDVEECLEKVRPHFVILCSATARHAEFV